MLASCSARSTRTFSLYRCVHQNKGCTSKRHQKDSGGTAPLGGAAAFKTSILLKYGGKLEEKQPQMHPKHADALKHSPLRPSQVLLFQLSHPQLSPPPPLMFSPPVLHTIFHPPLLFPLTALNRGLTVWADGGRVGGARGSAVAAGSVLREGFHEQHPGNQWLHWGPFPLLGQPGYLGL